MSEPTPRPWLADGGSRIQGNSDGHRYDIARMCLPSHLSGVGAPDASYLKAEANADHIVKCVNEHDGLVASLARYGQHRASCKVYGNDGQFCNCGWRAVMAKLESALAEATETPA